MKRYRLQFSTLSFILLVIVCASSCGGAGDAVKSTDQANIQGVWLAHTEIQNGIKKAVTYQYVFKGDEITFTDETGKEMKYFFKLDSINNLKLIIIKPVDEITDTTSVSVGYELKGDSLKIVVAPPSMRPTEISDRNNQELIICKRKSL